MKLKETLKALEAAGTAQNRKIYARHGVSREMYGVSVADLKALARTIKVDHALAADLWLSGNHDARVLACMVADPAAVKASELEAWVKDLDNYVLSDSFSELVARSPHAAAKGERWSRARGEWVGATGWTVLAQLVMRDEGIPETYWREKLKIIEAGIHDAKNRTRYSMNNALIAIGIRSPALEELAVKTAERIGAVEVDHGETGCRTPDAVPYIRKAAAHHRAKAAKAAARRAPAKGSATKSTAGTAAAKVAKNSTGRKPRSR